jgi:hypothetical protein
MKRLSALFDRSFEPVQEGPALLTGFLLANVDMAEWESVQLLNGGRLAVVAAPLRQEEVSNLLDALRRLTDVAVVVNARLYEVDRAFYTRHIAPLFAKFKNPDERPRVLPIESSALLRQIVRHKLLLESEETKLQPHQDAAFLSRQNAFRFVSGPPDRAGRPRYGAGLEGVSFEVRPVVSSDRRFLRLTISQKVTQLVRIDKTATLDITSGKDVEVESPNLRRSTVTGTVHIPDGNPILMPVDYRPAGKEHKDKVWLLVARPFIWIEEEVKEIRRQGGDVTSKSLWEADVSKEDD